MFAKAVIQASQVLEKTIADVPESAQAMHASERAANQATIVQINSNQEGEEHEYKHYNMANGSQKRVTWNLQQRQRKRITPQAMYEKEADINNEEHEQDEDMIQSIHDGMDNSKQKMMKLFIPFLIISMLVLLYLFMS